MIPNVTFTEDSDKNGLVITLDSEESLDAVAGVFGLFSAATGDEQFMAEFSAETEVDPRYATAVERAQQYTAGLTTLLEGRNFMLTAGYSVEQINALLAGTTPEDRVGLFSAITELAHVVLFIASVAGLDEDQFRAELADALAAGLADALPVQEVASE